MSADLFLSLLTLSVVLTIVLTNALKTLLNAANVPYRAHAVVLDSAMVCCTGVGVLYRLPFGLGFEYSQLLRLVLLILYTWVVSMVVYDKVIQTIEQYAEFRKKKGEKDNV